LPKDVKAPHLGKVDTVRTSLNKVRLAPTRKPSARKMETIREAFVPMMISEVENLVEA
jgi:hypothetical protein